MYHLYFEQIKVHIVLCVTSEILLDLVHYKAQQDLRQVQPLLRITELEGHTGLAYAM